MKADYIDRLRSSPPGLMLSYGNKKKCKPSWAFEDFHFRPEGLFSKYLLVPEINLFIFLCEFNIFQLFPFPAN